MKILIRGAGDLATGIAAELWERGHQILMTDVAIPLTVRREVAFSRAVYEEHAVVEGIEAVLAENFEEAETIMATRKIAVMVDEKAEVRKEYLPDVLVDGIMAKKNLGTQISDAPLVIGIGPGFTAAGDCHFVIETDVYKRQPPDPEAEPYFHQPSHSHIRYDVSLPESLHHPERSPYYS